MSNPALEQTILDGIDSANRDHPIVFPQVRRFEELFHEVEPWDGKPSRSLGTRTDGRETITFGDYLSVEGHDTRYRGLRVLSASPVLIDYLRDNLLLVDNDITHFKAVVHNDGTALLIVSYGQILGTRWLAIVDAASIPSFD